MSDGIVVSGRSELDSRQHAVDQWKSVYSGRSLCEDAYSRAINDAASLLHAGHVDFSEWLSLVRLANSALR